jgi:hypothetical protein
MNANVALAFAPRASVRTVRKLAARKARVTTAHHAQLPPSAGARVEGMLMGITFVSLAGLAVIMEAVGTSLF